MQKNAKKLPNILAPIGLVAKGLIYLLLGGLSLLAAMGMGGKESDKQDIFKMILEKPLGKVFLGLLLAGLLCYSLWRFIQGILDSDHKGSSKESIFKRIGYIFSGLLYLAIAFSGYKIFNHEDSGSSTSEQISELLNKPFGKWMVIILGAFVIGRGIFQLYISYSGKLRKKLTGGDAKVKEWAVRAGKFGYTSRAIVLLIIGYFFIKAGVHVNPSEATDTKGAFDSFKEYQYGSVLLCIVSAGLAFYGLFMFVEARYRRIN